MATLAWHTGYDEYSIDPEAVNPYEYESTAFLDWEDGFYSALQDYTRDYDNDRSLDEEWIVDPEYDDYD
jgi:hypothetical protein